MNPKHISIFLVLLFCSSILAVSALGKEDYTGQFKDKLKEAIKNPQVAKLIGNERINLYLDGDFEGHIVTENNEITSIGEDKLDDPTLEVYVKLKESKALAEGEIDFLEAVDQGIIKFKGVGFLKSLKFGTASFASKTFYFFRNLFKNRCENVTCSDSAINCSDGTQATCKNKCKRRTGECTDCTPECPTAIDPINDTVPATQCDDANPCTIDTYNSATGRCEHTLKTCDDQDACTTDACSRGQCVHTTRVCDDQDPCTDDACSRGQCAHTLKVCDDQDPNTQDMCNPRTGLCEHAILSNPTILEGNIVTNTNQMNNVIDIIFIDAENPGQSYQGAIVLDAGGQSKDLTVDVGFNIDPNKLYLIIYGWVSGPKISFKESVMENIKLFGPIDAIILGDGTQNSHLAVAVLFSPAGGIQLGPVVTNYEASDLSGDSSNNLLVGSSAPEIITGEQGDDYIFGRGGDDALYGNGGNDIIYGDANDLIDGGLGTDTLISDGVDLSVVSNIEIIELDSILANLQLDHLIVNTLGNSNTAAAVTLNSNIELFVKGSGTVSFTDSDWISAGTASYDGASFNVWENTMQVPDAVVAIEQSMTVEVSD